MVAPAVLLGGTFIGRAAELATLGRSLGEARAGQGGVVLLSGDPGIGKTRTLEEAVVGVARDRVLWGRCRESVGAPAYWPWIQALRAYVEPRSPEALAEELGEGATDLARLLPAVRERLPELAPLPPLQPAQVRFRLFDAVARFLSRASRAELLVVALDDLHWADGESLLLLRFVAAEITRTRCLILGTYRDVEMRQVAAVPSILGDLARLCRRIPLSGLSGEETSALVREVGMDLPAKTVADMHQATDGNPFFLREVVALAAREGVDARGFRVPSEVRATIRRRLEPLGNDARELLAIAAVLGRDFDVGLLSTVGAYDGQEVLEHLRAPLASGLVGEVKGTVGRYRFAHALVRDTVYDDLPDARRDDLHGRAAEALLARHARDLDPVLGTVAHHFLRAGDRALAPAIEYSMRAANLARQRFDYEEAAGHYERVLEAQRAAGCERAERLAVLLAFGEAQAYSGDLDGQRATFVDAARLARESGDAEGLARAALGMALLKRQVGPMDPLQVALLEEARRALPEKDSALLASVLGHLALASHDGYPLARRDALGRQGLEMARRVGDAETLAEVLLNRHLTLLAAGVLEGRLALALEMVRLAESVGAHDVACEGHLSAVVDCLELGDVEAAVRELDAALRLAEEHRLLRHLWQATVAKASLALLAGHLSEAEAQAERAMRISQGTFPEDSATYYGAQLTHVRRAQGRLAEVLPLAVAAAKRNRTPVFRCRLASNFAHVGDLTESRKLLDELAAGDLADLPKDWSWLPCLVLLAEVCIRVGDLRRAALVYERLLPHAERVAVLGRLAACYGPVARYLGDLATSLGWLDEAIGHFEAAIERCAGMGALPDLARAKQGLGRALAARGGPVDLERADRVRAEAASIARELGIGELLDSPSRAAAIPSRAESTTAARPAVLRREGDFWTVACADEATRVRHSKGVAYLAHLLRHSGQEFHAFDLAGQDVARGGDAGEALDAAARAAYKRRLADLREELAEAEERGDIGRAERLREEMGVLASELARALGLGGRVRRSGSDAERARLNVGRAIGAAVRRIAADCPVLGSHLARSVHTGLFCSYQPDPAHPLVWDA